MTNTFLKIISVFHSVEVFTKYLEDKKWQVGSEQRYQYGGTVAVILREGLKVEEIINIDGVPNATIVGYNFIVDTFLKEHDIDWEILSKGRLPFDIGMVANNISGPWDYDSTGKLKEERKEESEMEKRIKKFTENWNRMVLAIQKYL